MKNQVIRSVVALVLTGVFLYTGHICIFGNGLVKVLQSDRRGKEEETSVTEATTAETTVTTTAVTTTKPSETTTKPETTVTTTKATTEKKTEESTSEAEESTEENAEEETERRKGLAGLFSGEIGGTKRFTTAPDGYFKDALFIGDSRTEELMMYGDLEGATFFARVSMSLYNMYDGTCKVNNGIGKTSFDRLISHHRFKKVYIMLGVNEIGYPREQTVRKYGELIEKIQKHQPNAIIFIQANIHLSRAESSKSKEINNKQLNDFNNRISAFADNKKIFYIDPNEEFDDISGNLNSDYTVDGTHLKAKYTYQWGEWLKTKAIV